MSTTRMVTLQRRPGPAGPVPDDFALQDRPLPALQPGQLRLHNIVMSVDPAMRGRLETTEKHYTTNFEIGQPLDGSAIGVVIDAGGSEMAPGTVVRHRPGWREHAVVDAVGESVVDVDAAPAGAWLGILGQTGFTAYVGLPRIAQLRAGDVVDARRRADRALRDDLPVRRVGSAEQHQPLDRSGAAQGDDLWPHRARPRGGPAGGPVRYSV